VARGAHVRSAVITLAITLGEPAGIGPDIVVKAIGRALPARVVIIADRDLLLARARQLSLSPRLCDWHPDGDTPDGATAVMHVPLRASVQPGVLDPRNSAYVLQTLEKAVDGCLDGSFGGMVTGPVHKGVINDAGIAFTGHTELLAERTGTPRVVMMLVGGGLRVALATTHMALRDVPAQLDRTMLEETLRILLSDLAWRYALPHARVAVAGLNPHAGESGYLGREEIDIIAPVVERLRGEGFDVQGPLPADTLFTPARLAQFDAVLTMFHDQGLPVLKFASFGRGINVTLGLPIVRTSVDHGTALDLAGSGNADEGSLIEAIEAAADMARNAASAKATGTASASPATPA
jgi:4-hydroxythreonine-4-phosphate dehydrogenase